MGESPLCRIDSEIDAATPLPDRTLPGPWWQALVLRDYHAINQGMGQVARPARDCTGELVEWVADFCTGEAPPTPRIIDTLTERETIVSNLGGRRRLVWTLVDQLSNGESQGPIALADFDDRGAVVQTIGTLRGYAARADLRLEPMNDGVLLVAEGDACADERDPRSCFRAIRVMVAGHRRFVARDLVDQNGRCAGRAFFPTRAEGLVGSGSRQRRYELRSAVKFTPTAMLVEEQLTLSADTRGFRSSDAAAAAVARMRVDRKIELRGGLLVADGPSLLQRWIAQDSSRPEPPAQEP